MWPTLRLVVALSLLGGTLVPSSWRAPVLAWQQPSTDATRALAEGERLRNTGTAANLKTAIVSYESAIGLARTAGDRKTEAAAITGLGRATEALGDRRKALQLFVEARSLHQANGDKSAEAYVLNFMATTHDWLGERAEANKVLEAALPLARESGDRRVEGITLNNFGLIQVNTGNRTRALEFYEQALAINREVKNIRGEAVTLSNIGYVHDQLGNKHLALKYMLEALPLRRQIGDPREEAVTLNNIGAVYFRMDDLQPAIDYYERALALWRVAGDTAGESATLHNMASVREAQADFQGALDLYRTALELQRTSQFRTGEGNTLHNLGRLYSALGQSDKARETYLKALELHRAVNNRASEASALNNLGAQELAAGALDRAAEYFDQALALWRATGDRYGEARTLLNVGRIASRRQDHDGARSTYARALELARAVNSRRTEGMLLHNLAAVEINAGRPEAALDLYDQAIALHRTLTDRIGEAATLYGRAQLHARAGRLPDAHDDIQSALQRIEGVRSAVVDPDLRMSYFATVQDYFDFAIDLEMQLHRTAPDAGWVGRAFELSERARARSFLDMMSEARVNIREGVDPDLLAREHALAESMSVKADRQTRLLGGTHTEAQAKAIADDLRALTAAHDEIKTRIRAASPRYAALTATAAPAEDVLRHQLLDAETLLVEYVLGSARSYVFVASREGLRAFELAGRAAIDAAALEFYRHVRSPESGASARTSARVLSQLLLEPIAATLGTKRLAIVPSGSLEYIPFAALPNPANDRPLLIDHEIVTLPSASALASLRSLPRPPAGPPRLMLLADPVFTADDPRVRRTSKPSPTPAGETAPGERPLVRSLQSLTDETIPARLDRLLGSRREAAGIAALLPKDRVTSAIGFDANRRTATAADVAQYGILHFATHAFLNSARPELSGIVLSLVDPDGRPQTGFLGLNELFNLKLQADLVVLSACQTALGKEVRGEGLIGLSRAFMYAGTPRVVASVWKVDDAATAELMKRFYQGMLGQSKLAPAAALRAAQRSVMADPRWSSPYYWAPFVLQGDWR